MEGYAMLMSPNKDETAVHGCHCPGDMAVRMREELARPWVWWMCPSRFKLVLWKGTYFACPLADQGLKRRLQHHSLSLPPTSNILLLYIKLSRLHCNRFNGQQTQKYLLFSHLCS